MQAIKFSCNDSYKQMLAPAGSDPRQLPVAFKLLAGSLSGDARVALLALALAATLLLVLLYSSCSSFGHVRARVKCVR